MTCRRERRKRARCTFCQMCALAAQKGREKAKHALKTHLPFPSESRRSRWRVKIKNNFSDRLDLRLLVGPRKRQQPVCVTPTKVYVHVSTSVYLLSSLSTETYLCPSEDIAGAVAALGPDDRARYKVSYKKKMVCLVLLQFCGAKDALEA